MEKKTCTVEGCPANHLARGMCSKHYYRWSRANPTQESPNCAAAGCARRARVKGMCEAHRKRQLKGKATIDGAIGRHVNKGRDCSVVSCGQPARARGLCGTHYQRKWNGLEADPEPCAVEGCDRRQARHSQINYCSGHDQAARRYGSATEQGNRIGSLDRKGYRVLRINGREVKEHRYLMEQLLGRRLLPGETVHHCNTVKDDNRTAGPLDANFRSGNLELWTKSQPSGGRVVDKIAWAVELLELYAPELLADEPTQLRLA